MRFFIQNTTTSTIPIPSITSWDEPVNIATQTTFGEIWMLQVYRSSNWPELTTSSGITKKFFALYSSDHSTGGTYLAEFDNPNLSDFVELGSCGFRAQTSVHEEAPYLVRIPDVPDSEDIMVFFHSKFPVQQTCAYSTSGGSLLNVDLNGSWTYHERLLGLLPANKGATELHTGYLSIIRNPLTGIAIKNADGYYEGLHHSAGGNLGTLNEADYQRALSIDGRSWWRAGIVNRTDYLSDHPTTGEGQAFRNQLYLTIQGVKCRFNSYSNVIAGDFADATKSLYPAIYASDDNYRYNMPIKYLYPTSDLNSSVITYYYDADTETIWCYAPEMDTDDIRDSTRLFVSSIDISQRELWEGVTNKVPAVDYPDRVSLTSVTRHLTNRAIFVFDVGDTGDATSLDDLIVNIHSVKANVNAWTVPLYVAGSVNAPIATVTRVGNTFTVSNVVVSTTTVYDYWIEVENSSGKKSMVSNLITLAL